MRHESQYDYERGYGPAREQNRWTEPNIMRAYDEDQIRRRSDIYEHPSQHPAQIRQGWDNDLRQQPRDDGAYRTTDEPRYREPSVGGPSSNSYAQPSNTGYNAPFGAGYNPGQRAETRPYQGGYNPGERDWNDRNQQYRPGTYDAARYDRGQEYASGTAPSYAQGAYPRQDYGPGGSYGPSTYRPTGAYDQGDDARHESSTRSAARPTPYGNAQPGWGQGASGGISTLGSTSHAGRGPKNYTRSDDRLEEEVNDALTRDHHLDASDIEVSVKDGEVTLSGAVCCRSDKFHAEQIVDSIIGVRDVTNRLRVDRQRSDGSGSTRPDERSASDRSSNAGATAARGSNDSSSKNARRTETSPSR